MTTTKVTKKQMAEIIKKIPAGWKYKPAIPKPAVIQPIAPYNFPSVDMRPVIKNIGLEVRQQAGGAPCAVHAFTFTLEYEYIRHVFSNLSEQYLQYVTFQVVKPQMTGGENFWALNQGYQKWGYVPQSWLPNQATMPATVYQNILDKGKGGLRWTQIFIKIWDPTIGATKNQLDQVVKCLDQDSPVGIGVLWPIEWKTHVINGVDLMVVPSAANKWTVVFDGHAVALVGYQKGPAFPGGGYFIFRNSWGKDWGDRGYGFMPFDYVLKYANDLFCWSFLVDRAGRPL